MVARSPDLALEMVRASLFATTASSVTRVGTQMIGEAQRTGALDVYRLASMSITFGRCEHLTPGALGQAVGHDGGLRAGGARRLGVNCGAALSTSAW